MSEESSISKRKRDSDSEEENRVKRQKMQDNTAPSSETPKTPQDILKAAYNAFSTNYIPSSLLYRNTQTEQLKATLESSSGSCTFIVGPPGTGKSESIKKLIAGFSSKTFHFVYLNCMELVEKGKSSLLQAITSSLPSSASTDSEELLVDYLMKGGTGQRKRILLVLDEIDSIYEQYTSFIASLFDCALKPKSKFILFAISNTINLTLPPLERQPTTIKFEEYNKDEMMELLKERLRSCNALSLFANSSLILIANRVRDLRKALIVCRKAIENLEVKGDSLPEVKVPEIAKLINSVVGSDVAAKLRSFHELHPKIVLTAAVLLKKSTSTPITCAKLREKYFALCKAFPVESLPRTALVDVLQNLQSSGNILHLEKGKAKSQDTWKVVIEVDESDVCFAVENIPQLFRLLSQ